MKGIVAALALACAATGAGAAELPLYQPPAAWVKPVAIPKMKPEHEEGAAQVLLQDVQSRFADDGDDFYQEIAVKLRTSQGLSQWGNVILSWRPDTETLVIHRLNIIRGSQTIDLLAGGKTVTVLRREQNLEMSMLDGALTATVQPEGLQVGDVLDMAYTRHTRDPVMKGRSEDWTFLSRPGAVGNAYIRAIWPKAKPMRWRTTQGLSQGVVAETAQGRELVFDMHDVEAPQPPRGAPLRFSYLGQLQLSDFGSWAEVSALSWPLYVKASTLAAGSPLLAEIARIKASSSDPKARAAAALRLVEEKVRYLYLGLNNGGYVPADADVTWSRRFGDCKAKTVLLLALLKGMGIDAQPALVNTETGDGLDERLPAMNSFDHVAIKAIIAGKTYWLDGTRVGDGALDDLPMPNFHFMLPVQAAGAVLERMQPTVYPDPQLETRMTLDASAGIDAPAKAHLEHVFRGDPGLALRNAMESASRTDQDRGMRAYWRKTVPWIEPKQVTLTRLADNQVMLTMDGEGALTWSKDSGGRDVFFDDSTIGFDVNFEREPGPDRDAPFAIPYPAFVKRTVTVTLPDHGAGFIMLNNFAVDRVVAGVAYRRTARLAQGVAVIETTQRAVGPEITAAEALASVAILRDWALHSVGVRALPQKADIDPDEARCAGGSDAVQACGALIAKAGADQAKLGLAYFSRGGAYLRARSWDTAISDFDKALQANPDLDRAYAGRAAADSAKLDHARAVKDLGEAIRLNPASPSYWLSRALANAALKQYPQSVADYTEAIARSDSKASLIYGRGVQYMALKDRAKAIADFDEALRLQPGLNGALIERGRVYADMGKTDLALADYDELLRRDPANAVVMRNRGLLFAAQKDFAKAIEAYDAALKARPGYAEALNSRGFSYQSQRDYAKALDDYNAALRITPDHRLTLTNRAVLMLAQNRPAEAMADIDHLVCLDPADTDSRLLRVQAHLMLKDYGQATADADKAVELAPAKPASYAVRSQVRFEKGEMKGALADLDQMVRLAPADPGALNRACWDRATRGVDLDKALQLCNAAVLTAPKTAGILDSRGLVHFRRGEYAQALADLDAAVQANPRQASSLYVKGLIELKQDHAAAGAADIAAAKALAPDVAETYAKMGLRPDGVPLAQNTATAAP